MTKSIGRPIDMPVDIRGPIEAVRDGINEGIDKFRDTVGDAAGGAVRDEIEKGTDQIRSEVHKEIRQGTDSFFDRATSTALNAAVGVGITYAALQGIKFIAKQFPTEYTKARGTLGLVTKKYNGVCALGERYGTENMDDVQADIYANWGKHSEKVVEATAALVAGYGSSGDGKDRAVSRADGWTSYYDANIYKKNMEIRLAELVRDEGSSEQDKARSEKLIEELKQERISEADKAEDIMYGTHEETPRTKNYEKELKNSFSMRDVYRDMYSSRYSREELIEKAGVWMNREMDKRENPTAGRDEEKEARLAHARGNAKEEESVPKAAVSRKSTLSAESAEKEESVPKAALPKKITLSAESERYLAQLREEVKNSDVGKGMTQQQLWSKLKESNKSG